MATKPSSSNGSNDSSGWQWFDLTDLDALWNNQADIATNAITDASHDFWRDLDTLWQWLDSVDMESLWNNCKHNKTKQEDTK
jgi:hypothetical protein